ncbi:MAG: hypothetical protein KC983_01755 [Phycisphaerales bacterium]|nr:hypothetical protein [Phycisphaerales bacterium]
MILDALLRPLRCAAPTVTLDPRRYDLDQLLPAPTGGFLRLGSRFAGGSAVRRRKARLTAVAPRLKRVLRADEQVQMIGVGTRGSELELLFLGGLLELTARTMVIVTNQRLLIMQINARNVPRDAVSQIRFQHIRAVSATTIGTLTIRTTDNAELVLHHVGVKDSRRLRECIRSAVPDAPIATSAALRALCPGCSNVVDPDHEACHACHEPFMSASRPGMLSALWPGLGELYAGFRGMGAVMTLATLGLWTIWVYRGIVQPEQIRYLVPLAAGWHLVHGFMTWYTTRQGCRLQRHAWQPA